MYYTPLSVCYHTRILPKQHLFKTITTIIQMLTLNSLRLSLITISCLLPGLISLWKSSRLNKMILRMSLENYHSHNSRMIKLKQRSLRMTLRNRLMMLTNLKMTLRNWVLPKKKRRNRKMTQRNRKKY